MLYINSAIAVAEPETGLTMLEKDILCRLASGKSDPQIAEELHISRAMLDLKLDAIYAHVGSGNRLQAAFWAACNL